MNNYYEMNTDDKLDLILQSNAMILYHMGISYANGQMTGYQDHEKAVECYRQAAILNSPEAMYCLAICYANGIGVPLSHATACEWYRTAGEMGHSPSLYCLGLCNENGWGVPVDREKAFDYFRRAAELGNQDAMNRLS